MAENSRKNEFFERESIAMMAITTSSSIKVNFFIFIHPYIVDYLLIVKSQVPGPVLTTSMALAL